jgi:uncharacterized protein YjiS (DUF1127 family)
MFLITFMRIVEQWRRFNHILDRLNTMSDRELSDIGIHRSDVIGFAMKQSEK